MPGLLQEIGDFLESLKKQNNNAYVSFEKKNRNIIFEKRELDQQYNKLLASPESKDHDAVYNSFKILDRKISQFEIELVNFILNNIQGCLAQLSLSFVKRNELIIFLHQLLLQIPVDHVYIFGSQVTGKYYPWSDVDVMIISDFFDKKSPSKRKAIALEIINKFETFSIQPVCFQCAEWYNSINNPFIKKVKNNSVLMMDNDSIKFLSRNPERLKNLLSLIN